jgi:hypothetical protein
MYPVDNPDTYGHLAAGRQIAQSGSVPTLDTFSFYTREARPFFNYEWLSDLAFYVVYAGGGERVLTGFVLVLLALLAALLVRRAFIKGGADAAVIAALLLVLAVPAARYRFSVRPHVFGFVGGALYLVAFTRLLDGSPSADKSARRWLIALPIAHLAWVNLHGSHLLGFAMAVVAFFAALRDPKLRRRIGLLLLAFVAASCVSPFGPRIVGDAIAHVWDPQYRELIQEWQPWTADRPVWLIIAVGLQTILLALSFPRVPRGPERTFSFVMAALLGVLALRSLRFIADFVLLTAPFVADGFTARVQTLSVQARRLSFAGAVCTTLVIVALFVTRAPPYAAFGMGFDRRDQAAASGAWLANHLPRARIWAGIDDAWYLMFAVPTARFLVDGRVPFYGPERMLEVRNAWASAERFVAMLRDHDVDVVVAQQSFTPHMLAVETLSRLPGWRLVSIEDRHCAFARETRDRQPLLARESFRALSPTYDPTPLLAPDSDLGAIERELARLPDDDNVRAYPAFVRAMLALRGLAREGGEAGFRAPATPMEKDAAFQAWQELRVAEARLGDLPVILTYRAIAATLACKLEDAEAALQAAKRDDETREALLTEQELLLRRGHIDAVKAFSEKMSAMRSVARDPWLVALRASLADPPRCP